MAILLIKPNINNVFISRVPSWAGRARVETKWHVKANRPNQIEGEVSPRLIGQVRLHKTAYYSRTKVMKQETSSRCAKIYSALRKRRVSVSSEFRNRPLQSVEATEAGYAFSGGLLKDSSD